MMYTTLVALMCSLTGPGCVEEIVTDTSMSELTWQGCMITGQIGVAKWMSEHPIYHSGWRLARWKCVAGHYNVQGRA